ncbi:hypothetical protein SEA_ATUIN_272 [Arthrobacter phage Atuin]|nr:hypothetical protein SEA_ATUIN_71 [Arthrobacter phage Atuin]
MLERVRAWFKDLEWLDRGDWGFVCFYVLMVLMNVAVIVLVFPSWAVIFPVLSGAYVLWSLITVINRSVKNNKALHKARIDFEKALKDFEDGMM